MSQVADWKLVSSAYLPHPLDAPLLAEGDTTLSPVTVPAYLPSVRRRYLLGNESGQKGGGLSDPPPTGPIKGTGTGA